MVVMILMGVDLIIFIVVPGYDSRPIRPFRILRCCNLLSYLSYTHDVSKGNQKNFLFYTFCLGRYPCLFYGDNYHDMWMGYYWQSWLDF